MILQVLMTNDGAYLNMHAENQFEMDILNRANKSFPRRTVHISIKEKEDHGYYNYGPPIIAEAVCQIELLPAETGKVKE